MKQVPTMAKARKSISSNNNNKKKIDTGSVTKHGVGKLDRGNQKDKRETLPL
jgi:hypothetical protein